MASRGTIRREAAARPRRVLVVDDAEGIRSYLANLLEMHGYHVDTAEDGRRALALVEAGAAPDVVLMDVMMPGVDGLETLRRIRETDPRLPVVILSVVGRASTIVEAMQAGAADYLNKPFEEEELEATLQQVLGCERSKTNASACSASSTATAAAWSGRVRHCAACARRSSRSRAPT